MSLIIQLLALSCLASGGMFALGGVVEAFHALRLWRARSARLGDLATSTATFVDVRGQVRSKAPLSAPLTGKACAQYTVVVQRGRGGTRDESPDLLVLVEARPFLVDDGTGRIEIDLVKQRVPVTGADHIKQKIERLTKPLDAMMTARLGRPAALWCAGRVVEATEIALLEGKEVSVVARKSAERWTPIHVTAGRVKVVALQTMLRAGFSTVWGGVLIFVWNWLR